MDELDLKIIELRKQRFSMKEIGHEVGRSRTYVFNVLKKAGLNGRLTYPELNTPEIYAKGDSVIASDLKIPISKVVAARKKLGIYRPRTVQMDLRRKHLAEKLFGYPPGPGFIDFIKREFAVLPPKKRALMEKFYLGGQSESLAEDINFDSNRSYRSVIKSELKEIVSNLDIHNLIEEGVLVNGSNVQNR